jgi:hypothetical protein
MNKYLANVHYGEKLAEQYKFWRPAENNPSTNHFVHNSFFLPSLQLVRSTMFSRILNLTLFGPVSSLNPLKLKILFEKSLKLKILFRKSLKLTILFGK